MREFGFLLTAIGQGSGVGKQCIQLTGGGASTSVATAGIAIIGVVFEDVAVIDIVIVNVAIVDFVVDGVFICQGDGGDRRVCLTDSILARP